MTSKPIISVNSLNKTFASPDKDIEIIAVKDVSVDIFQGEVVVVIGPSGAGKSTIALELLEMAKLLDCSDNASIWIDYNKFP